MLNRGNPYLDEIDFQAMGATAAQKRARKEEGLLRKELRVKQQVGSLEIEPEARLIMHDDNQAMIQVCRSGKMDK